MFAKQAADKIVYDFLIKKADEDSEDMPAPDKERRKKFWLTLAALGGGAAAVGAGLYYVNKNKESIGNLIAGKPDTDERTALQKFREDTFPYAGAAALAGGLAPLATRLHPYAGVAGPRNANPNSAIGSATDKLRTFLGGNTPETRVGLAENLEATKARKWYDIAPYRTGKPTEAAVEARSAIPDEAERNRHFREIATALRESGTPASKQVPGSKSHALSELVEQKSIPDYKPRWLVGKDVNTVDVLKHQLGRYESLMEEEKKTGKTPAELAHIRTLATVKPGEVMPVTELRRAIAEASRGGTVRSGLGRAALAVPITSGIGLGINALLGKGE
jgi:hypothetical protein